MARPRLIDQDDVLEKAMRLFWARGFEATSMADLVEATGSTRHAIYGDFESKDGLYSQCFGLYRETIVEPAIARMLEPEASLEAVADYFETQIALAEKFGLPGPGCLVGNAMTERAPSNAEVAMLVERHNRLLAKAFAAALPSNLKPERRAELADFLVLSAQGLWAISRVTKSAEALRVSAATIVSLVEREIDNDS